MLRRISYDIASEYGRAALDRRHIATINYVYELPFFRDDHGIAGAVLWRMAGASGIVTFQSGLPYGNHVII